ncbi:hypothetical protein SAY87_027067 [Trapa incisa]|uniref:Uncharacterized protein n=1 Tax=Trapa incisa TaxID=236973 RepID=A0AAN7JMG2_9MYRT|nr:hypothetical protein SAY87_027067 [Trapa incisa]
MAETTDASVSGRESAVATSLSSVSPHTLCISVGGPLSPAEARLWRPPAQRNLRNQWSKLASCRQQWASSSSGGRSHATSLVNAYLSQRYMPSMDLGVLKDMADIRKKACQKLFRQQELYQSKLTSSYQDMITALVNMITAWRSMRCYLKGGTSSPLIRFSYIAEDKSDNGDGSGTPVFTFLSIPCFENLAEELVEMFKSELFVKRLIVFELCCAGHKASYIKDLNWSNELYSGEFNDLAFCNLYSSKTHELLPPKMKGCRCDMPSEKHCSQLTQETLQVYVTAWLAEVNIDMQRVREIFSIVGEEMHVNFS